MRKLLALSGVLALLAAGCGSDEEGEPIPQEIVAAIEQQLDAIQNRVDADNPGACDDIEQDDADGTLAEVDRRVAAIPQDVDADVRDALEQSVERLKELVRSECDSIREDTETTTTPPPTETAPPETVPPETVPTETVPPEEEEQDQGGQEERPGRRRGQDGGAPPGGGGGGGGGAPAPEGDE